MSTQTKTQEAETTEIREIKTDFARAIHERRELAIRNQRAQAYSNKCKSKKIAKANRKQKIKDNIILGILYIVLITAIVMKSGLIGSFKECEIIGINGNTVTVEYNGQLYDFYGNGYSVGETITCKFTNNMKLVEVK